MEERLVKFARIVDAGSFTKAAGELHISQPALTIAVKKLERELQAELLLRGSHPLRVSAAGAIAYQTARTLMVQTQNLEVRIRQTTHQKIVLRLGLIDSVAAMLFVQDGYLQELEQAAHVSLSIDNSSRLLTLTERGELDVALIAEPTHLPRTLQAAAIGPEPLMLVTHPQQALSVRQQLAQKNISHFLSYNQASRTFQVIGEYFAEQGITVQPTFYSTSPEIMLQLVLNQRGSAVLPYTLVQPHLDQAKLATLELAGKPLIINRTIISIQRPGRILPTVAAVLLQKTQHKLQKLRNRAKHQ